jgi:hypothetical protein
MKKSIALIMVILSAFIGGISFADQVCNDASEWVNPTTHTWGYGATWPVLVGPYYFKPGDPVTKPVFVGAEIGNNTSGNISHTVICLYTDAAAPKKIFAVNMTFENVFPMPGKNFECIPNRLCDCPKNSANINSLHSEISVFDCAFTYTS